jgi:hypothetical protein
VQIGRVNQEHARCGFVQSFEWQTSVGRIARSSRRKVERPFGGNEKNASRTETRSSSDEGHGWLEGETVRGRGFPKSSRGRLAGLTICEALEHDERRSRTTGRQAFTGKAIPSPLARRSNASSIPSRKGADRVASGSGGSDTDSGVPTGDDENVRGRHGSVKALRGWRTSEGSPYPRR